MRVLPVSPYLSPAEAAAQLGVSPKALRLYEARGLLSPLRTQAGWRAYGSDQMARAREIASLRALGLSLTQVARVLAGDPGDLAPALAAHQAELEGETQRLSETLAQVAALRRALAKGEPPTMTQLAQLAGNKPACAFDLPWPWGGERFELAALPALTWLVGSLGSGKTRLARAIADALPGSVFVEMARPPVIVEGDLGLSGRLEGALAWLREEGAEETEALRRLLAAVLSEGGAVVVDMVEDGLNEPTQQALAAWLRARGPQARPLILMTRSSAMLDLGLATSFETVLFCPANHSSPIRVRPDPQARGYEALASCLAPPEVRARTEGMVAVNANRA
ncbi:MerR family transcriptional regulator [Phenylobacterium sp.]|uniref:MerR family transcriptional regulator n=1 Tax=Phenylobacterium sp. TaxID=1871053 RepID=UPI00300111E7